MNQGTHKWIVTGITLLGICAIFTGGCDRHLRYKTLSFFFTGVPPIYGEDVLSFEVDKKEKTGVNTKAGKDKEDSKPKKSKTHGPYAAGQCYQCHITKQKEHLKPSEYEGGFPRLNDLPGKLRMPKNELCVDCHVSKTVESAFERNLWIHGPVSTGMCTQCHHHHSSKAEYMLLEEDSVTLCTRCHSSELLLDTKEHAEGEQCTFCHNAHVGKTRFLLKKDFNELY